MTGWDDTGRPASWVTQAETEWDRRERSLMLALSYFEAACCKRCGEHLSRAMDPMTDPDRPEAPHNWRAEGPDECFSCKALVTAERKLADSEGGADAAAYMVFHPTLVPVRPRKRRSTK